MTIQVTSEKNSLCDKYKADAPNGALFSGTPGGGTPGNATNEITGGSPAYARKACTWGTSSGGAIVGAGSTFDVASGTTVTFFGVAASLTATTNDIKDWASVTSQAFGSQGQYTITPTYTQT